jgi:hypothetical protein
LLVVDVQAVFVATRIALACSRSASAFDTPIESLDGIMKSSLPADRKNVLALEATDNLRGVVADELAQDRVENPKQRYKLPEKVAKNSGPLR